MKIDWNTVEGYDENLSPEEKLALLEKHEFPNPTNEGSPDASQGNKGGTNWKAQFDKTASELAAVKKQLRAKMTDDEAKESERQAAQEAMETELKELRRDRTISTHKAAFLAQGYDEALADEAAVAMTDGETDTVFLAMKKHAAAVEKELRAKILKETPAPPAGDDPNNDAKKKKEMDELRASFGLPPLK